MVLCICVMNNSGLVSILIQQSTLCQKLKHLRSFLTANPSKHRFRNYIHTACIKSPRIHAVTAILYSDLTLLCSMRILCEVQKIVSERKITFIQKKSTVKFFLTCQMVNRVLHWLIHSSKNTASKCHFYLPQINAILQRFPVPKLSLFHGWYDYSIVLNFFTK